MPINESYKAQKGFSVLHVFEENGIKYLELYITPSQHAETAPLEFDAEIAGCELIQPKFYRDGIPVSEPFPTEVENVRARLHDFQSDTDIKGWPTWAKLAHNAAIKTIENKFAR
jgi:hypothetical protein